MRSHQRHMFSSEKTAGPQLASATPKAMVRLAIDALRQGLPKSPCSDVVRTAAGDETLGKRYSSETRSA